MKTHALYVTLFGTLIAVTLTGCGGDRQDPIYSTLYRHPSLAYGIHEGVVRESYVSGVINPMPGSMDD